MPASTASRTLIPLVALAALASLSTCTCDAPPPTQPARLPLDTILGPGEVRCGLVEKPSELIGGPAAYARVGHAWRCHNAVIRFIVQDAVRPVGNSVEGGNLIDLDRVRPDENVDGEDTFREHVPALGANEVRVEKIEVINDGSNGEPGVLRVSGRPTTITLAPQAVTLSQDMVGEVFTDYTLRPDSDVIEIETTFSNEGEPLLGGLGADFLSFGGATPPTSPEFGFNDVPLLSNISFLAGARGKGSNIAFVCDHKDANIPLVESGATVAICDDRLIIGGIGSFKRSIVVGDGSVDSVASRAWQLLEVETGTVSGTVAGIPASLVEGTVVTALTAPLATEGAHAINEARVVASADVTPGASSDQTGAFTMTLPPGSYTLIAHVPGQTGQVIGRSAEVAVVVTANADVTADALTLGGAGHIDVVTSFDDPFAGDDSTHPAKLTLVPLDDTQRPEGVLHDFSRSGAARYQVSTDGVFSADVPPGLWRVLVTRGFEWSRHDETIDVAADGTVVVDAALSRAIDSRDFLAGEFHQHTLGSIDAVVPVPLKVLENAAEGIEIAVSTDHDNIVDFQPFVDELGLQDDLVAFVGEEVSYQAIGHFNVYPFDLDPADPFRDIGSRIWWLKTLPELYRDVRAAAGHKDGDDDAAGQAIIQLNHPRSGSTGATTSMNFDPSTARRIPRAAPVEPTLPPNIYTAWSPDFDAIEVNTNLGDPTLFTADGAALAALADDDATAVPVLADWLAMLGAGLPVAAMGNSDTHSLNEGVGYPRTYLHTGTDDPTTLDGGTLRATIRAQKTAIAEGCLLTLDVDDAPRMGRGDLLARADADRLTLRLQAPPHVTVGRLEVYVNGVAQLLVPGRADVGAGAGSVDVDAAGVLSLPLSGLVSATSQRLKHALQNLPLDTDAVVVAVSRGGSGLTPTGGGEVVCISPAAYVDADGDGVFSPWLAATEDITRVTE